ncbi:sensor histidine kinase [Halobacillus litoralis]|uniref:histidine kinase n=1 Tax=Halobacillus litoralis TaxID=45668 RepID=A0A410MI06_9BACI|nr:HAMP domain-containing sensor histidine kinase [Halobacillus litoralis]QAS54296.1 sensor histidine kinase [Halobacillus litoralis]
MKIRTWLMVSYLIVMMLPLAAAYGFFLLVQDWDQSRRPADTFELTEQLRSIEDQLQSPALYQVQQLESIEKVLPKSIDDDRITLKLYRTDGVRVYHSEDEHHSLQQMDRSRLLKNLYQYDLTYHTLKVKKPVFENQQIQGVYEISIDRSNWVEGVETRRTMMTVAFLVLFILLYAAVLWLLQKKLNNPLKELMTGMSTFAEKHETVHFTQKKNDEIGRLMTHFEQMQKQVETAQKETEREQEEKQLMMASFSHDIKTPLTSLQTYAEALQNEKGLTQEEREEYLQILAKKSCHLKGMIEDLTTYAKLQSAHYEMPLLEVDAEEFFDMLFEGYDELAAQEGVSLKKEHSITGPLRVNDRQMIRYVDNLMSNALRYTTEGKMIGLAAVGSEMQLPAWVFADKVAEVDRFRGSKALLLVQNEGPAIDEEHLESIFMPFYQGEGARTSDVTKNSGLGLSIALMIAEKHGGEMKLWSLPGKGTLIAMKFDDQHVKERLII